MIREPNWSPRQRRNLATLSWQAAMYAAGYEPVSQPLWEVETPKASTFKPLWHEITLSIIRRLTAEYLDHRICFTVTA